MLCIAAETIYCHRVKAGIEQVWWQDREIMTLSYWRHGRLYRTYVVLHPITGVQVGFVRWWYGQPRGED
jgi:hypothetical protein